MTRIHTHTNTHTLTHESKSIIIANKRNAMVAIAFYYWAEQTENTIPQQVRGQTNRSAKNFFPTLKMKLFSGQTKAKNKKIL